MIAARVIVFSRAPVPGSVKTRLIPALGAEGAVELHRRMTLLTLETVSCVEGVDVELWCSPNTSHPFFEACRRRFGVRLRSQEGTGLGERMYRALAASRGSAVLIGADCPDLSAGDVHVARERLNGGCDAVVMPAEDGGYALIGTRRPHPMLFEDITWGGDEVMTLTRERLRALGWHWHELPVRWDVDRPEDLARLPAHLLPAAAMDRN